MSSFAKDEKGKYVYANNINFDINKIYYCPNDECTSKLKIKAIDSVNVISHFSSLKNYPHSELCPYKNSYSYTKMDYSKLDMMEFYNKILNTNHKSKDDVKNNIKENNAPDESIINVKNSYSIKSLYYYLSRLDVEQYLGDKKVKDYLVSKSTYEYYKKGNSLDIRGVKIIECAFAKVFYNCKDFVFKIYCSYHFGFDIDHTPKIKLDFSSDKHSVKLFKEYVTEFKQLRDSCGLKDSKKSYPTLVIMGEVGDDLIVKITNKRQIAVL